MAIRKVAGHAVSSVAPQHHQQVQAANVSFPANTGKAGYNGGSSKGGFPPKGGSKSGRNAAEPNKSVSPLL